VHRRCRSKELVGRLRKEGGKLVGPKTDEGRPNNNSATPSQGVHNKNNTNKTTTSRKTTFVKPIASEPIRRPKNDKNNKESEKSTTNTVVPAPASSPTQSPTVHTALPKPAHLASPPSIDLSNSDVDAKDLIFALAIADSSKPKGMHVVFGNLVDNCLNATMELDGSDHATSVSPTSFNIADIFRNHSFINLREITALPTQGVLWEPRFASTINITRQANAASFRKAGIDESVDIGEVVDMAARHTMSENAAAILNVDSSHHKPPVTAGQINGAQLRDLLSLPTITTADRPQLVNQALVPSTVSEHNRMLTKLQDLPESCHRLPLPIAIATYL
jgi:hypothetical protein